MESRERKVNLTGMKPYYFDKRESQKQNKHSSADDGFDKILEHERLRIREELEHGLKIPEQSKRN